jgi:predicted permease
MATWWARVRSILRRLVAGHGVDRALDEEIQAYVREEIESRVRSGMSPGEARRTALAELGGIEPVKERVRDARTGAWIDSLTQDVRYAVRTLAKSPGYALSVIGSLGLGIAGLVSAVAFVNGAIFLPFPGVTNQHELVAIAYRQCNEYNCWTAAATPDDYAVLRRDVRDFRGLAATSSQNVSAALPEPRALGALLVSENYFDVLGARTALGRPFGADQADPAKAAVAILSHRLWVREFNGDPSVLGRTILVAGQSVHIIGVAPEAFGGLSVRFGFPGPDLWLPLALAAQIPNARPGWESFRLIGERHVQIVGRLAPGAEIRRIQAQADVVSARIASRGPDTEPAHAEVSRVWMHDPARFAPVMAMVLAVPILVLTIACVNAANLLLARGSTRGHEIAVRLAIGASRGRIVRQLLTESLLLALAATILAFPLVWWGLQVAERYVALPMPLDATVVSLALAAALASALGCGLAPAFRITARQPATAFSPFRNSDRPVQTRSRRVLVVVQVALSLGLLATGLQLVAALKGTARTVGTPPDRLLMVSFDLRQLDFQAPEADAFYAQLLERVSQLPQIEAAGIAPPRAVWTLRRGVQLDNSVVIWRPTDPPRRGRVILGGAADGAFFEALGLRVLQGRTFTSDDRRERLPQAAVVNRPFADELLGGQALGQVLRVVARDQRAGDAVEVRVVGVIEPASEPSYTRNGRPVPAIYLPRPLRHDAALTLYARARASADVLKPIVQQVVRGIDPRVPLLDVESLAELNERMLSPVDTFADAAALLGLEALVLAAWGLFAVVSYTVSLRSREIAVRLALGARPRAMLTMVLRQAMTLALIGAAIGGAAGLVVGTFIQDDVRPPAGTGPAALLASTALLLGAMVTAALVPAIHAARVDPMSLLKEN